MKNRLQIAREFLRDDGVIFIQCDDNEQAYLKVLCDEIFGRENFVGNIVWLKGNAQNDADTLQRNQEYILCYAKNITTKSIYKIKQKVQVKAFKDEKTGRFYYEGAGLTMGGGDGGSLENRPNLGYTFYYNPQTHDIKSLLDYDKDSVKTITNHDELYNDNEELIAQGYVPIRPQKWALKKRLTSLIGFLLRVVKMAILFLRKEWLDSKQVKQDEKGAYYAIVEKENPPKSFADFVGRGVGAKENKAFMKYIIEISTKGVAQETTPDLVMDFFAGSGTTLAVAMKMNRRFVGIEQMDYIESIAKERLQKVIAGEQGGISKAVGWSGDGGFIYCELMPLNAIYKERILSLRGEAEAIHKKADSMDCHEFASANSRNDKKGKMMSENLSKKLATKLEGEEIEIPSYIKDNLSKELREYQIKALRHYLKQRQLHEKGVSGYVGNHLLFNMATGSGKTLNLAKVKES